MKKRISINDLANSKWIRIVSLILGLIVIAFLLIEFSLPNFGLSGIRISGMAAAPSTLDRGCCDFFCGESFENECEGDFFAGKSCSAVASCNVGCCMDANNYCMSNFLKGNCERAGNKFISNECSEIMECVSRPGENQVRNPTGITIAPNLNVTGIYADSGVDVNSLMLSDSEQGMPVSYAKAEPFAAPLGSFFKIKYFTRKSINISGVEAVLKDNGVIVATIPLYDDANHDDGLLGDGNYANVWDSSSLPPFTGQKTITVDMNVVTKDLSSSHFYSVATFSVMASGRCNPLRKPDPMALTNIFLMGNNYAGFGDEAQLESDLKKNFIRLSYTSPLAENSDSINYYMIPYDNNVENDVSAVRIIMAECPFFQPTNDFIFIFDPAVPGCSKLSYGADNVYMTNPKVSSSAEQYQLSDMYADACKMNKGVPQAIIEAYDNLPKPGFLTEDNTIFDQNEFALDFNVTGSSDDEISYSIFVDNLDSGARLEFNGSTSNGAAASRTIVLDKGNYVADIFAQNSKGDSMISKALHFTVTSSISYSVSLSSPEEGSSIAHNYINAVFKADSSLPLEFDYTIFLDDIIKAQGKVLSNADTNVTIADVPAQDHRIFVRINDSFGGYSDSQQIFFTSTAPVAPIQGEINVG